MTVPLRPTREQGCLYQQRLLDEADRLASSDVASVYIPLLLQALPARKPHLDPDLYVQASNDAVVEFIKNPGRYDPERLELLSYLLMAAERDLANLLRSEQRHQRQRTLWNLVENDAEAGNLSGREETPAEALLRAEEWHHLDMLVRELPERDQQIVALIRAGTRDTAAFVPLLGLEERPFAEQQRAVKRAKDRILRRLQRRGGSS